MDMDLLAGELGRRHPDLCLRRASHVDPEAHWRRRREHAGRADAPDPAAHAPDPHGPREARLPDSLQAYQGLDRQLPHDPPRLRRHRCRHLHLCSLRRLLCREGRRFPGGFPVRVQRRGLAGGAGLGAGDLCDGAAEHVHRLPGDDVGQLGRHRAPPHEVHDRRSVHLHSHHHGELDRPPEPHHRRHRQQRPEVRRRGRGDDRHREA
mmetsp:Transcript_23763/g.64678  ORF Transcript_23763/g.64678 Transcript_23763/m.64678 type:complete len:207 (-) Transcript_23763:665-1285(-)